jgi:hypothetical protein
LRQVEVTVTLRARAPGRQPSRSDHYAIYYVPALRKVGMSAVLERRLREQGIPESEVRVLELIPRSRGARHAGDRERWWCDLLGCDPGTHYAGMLERGERSRRRLEKESTRRSSGERRPGMTA